ncbi:PAS domain S-box protein [Mucilaginibacter sp. CSA2-8R]|uniref:PAS domain S-box protein n=1 Tax=Mucilaginibacter sp. CSA2-8R TaxID=3141542 RepID=UPI00315DC234
MLINSVNSTSYGDYNPSFHAFFENSTEAMLIVAPNGSIVDANAPACLLFKTTNEQLCKADYRAITEIQSTTLTQLYEQAANSGKVSAKLHFKRSELSFSYGWVNVFLLDSKLSSESLMGFIIHDTTEIATDDAVTEESYQQIVQLAKEGIWVYNEEYITTFASQALCDMLGYEHQEMVGRDIFYFIDESRRKQAVENAKRRKDGIAEKYDFALQTKSGSLIWTIINTTPVFKDGVYTGAIAVITDVTARKKLEDEMYSRADRFRVMVENSYDVILLLDKNMHTFYRSPSTTNIMGFSDDERLGHSFLELTHPDDIEKLKGLQQWVANHPGQSVPITVRARHTQGHYLWFMGVATNLLNNKNVQAVVVNLRDITERKKVEDDLKQLSNRLQLATQAANVCISDWDIINNHVTYDDCMFDLYKVKPEEFKKTYESWTERLHPDDLDRINQEVADALRDKSEVKMKFKILLPGNEIRHLVSMSIIERDASGRAVRMVATNRDVTKQIVAAKEREKLIAELIERNKALEQFAYIVSHNLRAPVANLVSLTEMITDTDLDEADHNEVARGINKSVAKIDQIISDLNEIFQSGQHLYDHKEVVELQALINDIRFSINDLMMREKVTLNCNFSKTCTIYTTRLYLYSILYNLVLNAIKYRKQDVLPVINVTGTHQNGRLNITIADNGRGIDLDRHGDKLFGLYQRFDNTVVGRGIGLYMVKTQVEALGGHITVKSEPGIGSQFSFYLPLNE